MNNNNTFINYHEKDCENEILNCFDMVWNGGVGAQQLAVGETPLDQFNTENCNPNNTGSSHRENSSLTAV